MKKRLSDSNRISRTCSDQFKVIMSNPPSSSNEGATEASINQEREQTDDAVWETPIIRRENGEPIGISIFLGDEDLRDLGLDIEIDEKVEYRITGNNKIRITNTSGNSGKR